MGENGWKSDRHGRWQEFDKKTHTLWARMGGKKINMAVGAEFTRRRTLCGREGVQISSTWPLVPNSRDDAPSVGPDGFRSDPLVIIAQSGDDGRSASAKVRKLDNPDCWCSILERLYNLWARMGQMSLPWLSVLNAGDDLPAVNATGENGIRICADSVFEVPGAFYLQCIQLALLNV